MLQKLLQSCLAFFAKRILKKYHPDVIGITGSVGKTTTKEVVAVVLASKFKVWSNYKNLNNQIGLPLAIMGIKASPGRSVGGWLEVFSRVAGLLIKRDANYPEKLVLEMGADRPGDIAYLIDIAPCRVGILTFISHAHTEYFSSIKKIAQEKRTLITGLPTDGFAILNADNELVRASAPLTTAKVITYGINSAADLKASDVKLLPSEITRGPFGITFKVSYGGNVVPVFLPGIVSSAFVSAALAGMAVGVAYGINLLEAAEALRPLEPLAGHMRPIEGIKHTLIVDDSYNSSPAAAREALQTLALFPVAAGAERYAVLGDMLELGTETETAHREIGFLVAELGIDFLITVGEASKITAAAAREAGLADHNVVSFAGSVEAGRFLQDILDEGDIVLVKGSQGSRMEKIVKEVMAEPLRAPELLVRQTEEWLER